MLSYALAGFPSAVLVVAWRRCRLPVLRLPRATPPTPGRARRHRRHTVRGPARPRPRPGPASSTPCGHGVAHREPRRPPISARSRRTRDRRRARADDHPHRRPPCCWPSCSAASRAWRLGTGRRRPSRDPSARWCPWRSAPAVRQRRPAGAAVRRHRPAAPPRPVTCRCPRAQHSAAVPHHAGAVPRPADRRHTRTVPRRVATAGDGRGLHPHRHRQGPDRPPADPRARRARTPCRRCSPCSASRSVNCSAAPSWSRPSSAGTASAT